MTQKYKATQESVLNRFKELTEAVTSEVGAIDHNFVLCADELITEIDLYLSSKIENINDFECVMTSMGFFSSVRNSKSFFLAMTAALRLSENDGIKIFRTCSAFYVFWIIMDRKVELYEIFVRILHEMFDAEYCGIMIKKMKSRNMVFSHSDKVPT